MSTSPMGANKPIEDIEATLLAATKSALRGAFAPTGSFSSGFNIGGPLQHPDRAYQKRPAGPPTSRATMPDILLLEWKFEPADLFEQSTTARIGEYEFAIEWGRVQCQILVDVEFDDYWLRQRTEAHQRMVAIFLAAQTFSDQPCKLLKPAASRMRERRRSRSLRLTPDRRRNDWACVRHEYRPACPAVSIDATHLASGLGTKWQKQQPSRIR
jgi:hypothetical protein